MSEKIRVAVGGTFDPLHDGHKALLAKAFELGDEIVIGLTSDEMIGAKITPLLDYETRKQNLSGYIESTYSTAPTITRIIRILKLHDSFGPTISQDFDYLVVSPETAANAEKINDIRREKGMQAIRVVLVDFVLADDEQPISSTRIKNREIDDHGHLIV